MYSAPALGVSGIVGYEKSYTKSQRMVPAKHYSEFLLFGFQQGESTIQISTAMGNTREWFQKGFQYLTFLLDSYDCLVDNTLSYLRCLEHNASLQIEANRHVL